MSLIFDKVLVGKKAFLPSLRRMTVQVEERTWNDSNDDERPKGPSVFFYALRML